MKELSIEEKAKAYDKVREKIALRFGLNVAEEIFSEFEESEDERVRKALIDFVKSRLAGFPDCKRFTDWLEKQGEYANFRNKIQVGDKVTRNEDGVLVNLSQLNRVAKSADKQGKQKSYACEQFSRLICGQDMSFQDLFEAAWEKRCKKAVGRLMDKEWEGGWQNMRSDAEGICNLIKKRFWGLDCQTLNGVHYDDNADILFDIYCVLRHQLWLDRPDDKKSTCTVDASEAMRFGSEPLAKISRKEDEK